MSAAASTDEGWCRPVRSVILSLHAAGCRGMALPFEAYTTDGLVRGTVATDDRLEEMLERVRSLAVDEARLVLVDGSELTAARVTVATEDLVAFVASDRALSPVHAVWHDLSLAAGPYLIEGLFPTLPGFDPGRALVRANGNFVLVGSARIALAADPGAGDAEYPLLWVNRYAVERVAADLELSLFFPGARTVVSSRSGPADGVSPPRLAADAGPRLAADAGG